jgi:hypothetical protein
MPAWRAYCKSGRKPVDIPAQPQKVYEGRGWVGTGDWLGSDTVATHQRRYRSFEDARAFVRSLGLKSVAEWRQFCNSGNKPADIPAAPWGTYADAGWSGMGDWIGTGRRRGGGWRNFKDARAFVRGLGLESGAEWRAYCQSGKKPDDIPAYPNDTYATSGWVGYGDWLGTGSKRPGVAWRPFKKARAFRRGLGLKSGAEWRAYCQSGKKPNDIRSNPQQAYATSGWAGMGDWLGYARKR